MFIIYSITLIEKKSSLRDWKLRAIISQIMTLFANYMVDNGLYEHLLIPLNRSSSR